MKIRLLNDGGYTGSLSGVKFPVEVEGYLDEGIPDGSAVFVKNSELIRIGGDRGVLEQLSDERYFVDDEFEVIS